MATDVSNLDLLCAGTVAPRFSAQRCLGRKRIESDAGAIVIGQEAPRH